MAVENITITRLSYTMEGTVTVPASRKDAVLEVDASLRGVEGTCLSCSCEQCHTRAGVLLVELLKKSLSVVLVGVHRVALPKKFCFSQQANVTMANTQRPVVAEGSTLVYSISKTFS